MRSYTLSKKKGNQIVEEIKRLWPNNPIYNAKNIRIIEIDSEDSILIGKEFVSVKVGKYIIPFLGMEQNLDSFTRIIVDKGAVQYVCRGAKIMRPGIIKWEGEFKMGDIVIVEESKYGKRLAIGIALLDSSELPNTSRGAILNNLHYIGDKFWETHKLF